MSHATTLVACPNLQDQLEDIFCTGRPEDTPLLNFLFSEFNNANILQRRAVPMAGKSRIVELVYFPRMVESEVTTTVTHQCEAPQKWGSLSTTYNIDETAGVNVGKYFDLVDLIPLCEDNDMFVARMVQNLIDVAKRTMETQAATKLVALAGGFSTIDLDQDNSAITSSTKIISTKNSTATNVLNDEGYAAIMQTARLNGYCSAPVVAGEYEIMKYFDRLKVGCCATTGVDMSQLTEPILLKSYRVPTAFGDNNKFLTFSAGAALPVWFNLNGGAKINEYNDDTNMRTIIIDPATGIPFDLVVTKGNVNTCTRIHYVVSLAWDLFAAPSDMFDVGDIYRGVNFIHKHIVTNPA